MNKRAAFWSACLATAFAGTVLGGDPHPSNPDFAKGAWCAQAYGSYMSDLSNRDVRFGGPNIGFGYYVFDNIALNLEAAGYAVDEPGPDGLAGSLTLLLRQHLAEFGKLSLYVDVGGGVTEAEHDMPPDGTRFNFILHTGPGVAWKLDTRCYLIGGARYVHLSNAQIEGSDHNPSVNGLEGYIGLMWTF